MAKIKKVKKNNHNQESRHFGVVLEDINSKIDLLVGGHQGLEVRLSRVEDKLNSHTQMIGHLAENVEIIKADVASIKVSLRKKIDAEEFMILEKRVALLERKVL